MNKYVTKSKGQSSRLLNFFFCEFLAHCELAASKVHVGLFLDFWRPDTSPRIWLVVVVTWLDFLREVLEPTTAPTVALFTFSWRPPLPGTIAWEAATKPRWGPPCDDGVVEVLRALLLTTGMVSNVFELCM